MNAAAYLMWAVSLCVLGSGCASDLTSRVIAVSTVQTTGESRSPAGVSPSLATNLFREVLSRLASSGYVTATHEQRDPANPMRVEYDSQFTATGSSSVDLTLVLDGKHVTFSGDTDSEPESVAELHKVVKLYRDSLDTRQIKYRVRTFTYHPTIGKKSGSRLTNREPM